MAKHRGLMCLQCRKPLVEVETVDVGGECLIKHVKCTSGHCFGHVWDRPGQKRPA
jgi:hypothetical protein